jgi:branched-chain amino acid aminotransferase
MRAIAWRGSELMGVSAKRDDVHVAIASWVWGDYFADKMKGVRLMVAPWRRPAPDTAPCNSKAAGLYMICTLSRARGDRRRLRRRDHDGLARPDRRRHRRQHLLRADGVLHTPYPDCFLNGITRQTVIGLAKARGIEVVERAIWPNELAASAKSSSPARPLKSPRCAKSRAAVQAGGDD